MNGFEQGNNDASSTMEKMANNLWTILIARVAMILTPVFIWMAAQWLDSRFEAVSRDQKNTQAQVDELRRSDRIAAATLQDHESRMVFGKAQRELFQSKAEIQFGKIDSSLNEINKTLYGIDATLGSLKAVIDERERARGRTGSIGNTRGQ